MQDPADGHDDDRGEDPWSDDEPLATGSGARTWVHPSEVGMDLRGRTDRRRGTVLAGGLVIGGIGLLVAGVLMGLGWGPADEPVDQTASTDSMAPSLASLTVATPTGRTNATGVLVDGDGHVAVRAGALDGATSVWATCGGRPPELVQFVAADGPSGVAVLRLSYQGGQPVTAAASPRTGQDVLMVRAGSGEREPQSWPAQVRSTRLSMLHDDGSVSDPMFRTAAPDGPSALVSTTLAGATTVAGATGDAEDGGAVFDRRGRFVGLVMDSGNSGQVAVPAHTVVAVARSLARTGRVDRPWIGVTSVDQKSTDAAAGALVTKVDADSPAAAAGLQPGDVITGVGDRDVTDMMDLAEALQQMDPGSRLPLTYVRDGAHRRVSVTTASRPTAPGSAATAASATASVPANATLAAPRP
jgi:putative serine protease PepD